MKREEEAMERSGGEMPSVLPLDLNLCMGESSIDDWCRTLWDNGSTVAI